MAQEEYDDSISAYREAAVAVLESLESSDIAADEDVAGNGDDRSLESEADQP